MESTGGIQSRYNAIKETYSQLQLQYNTQEKQLSKKIIQSGWNRLVIFILMIAIPIYLYNFSVIFASILFVGFATSFGILIKQFNKLKRAKAEVILLEELNKAELTALEGKYNQFKNGENYINPQHDYSYDLDLFGEGSFFQYLNRTATLEGSNQLATKLSSPLLESNTILKEQEAIKELSSKLNFRQHFYAKGHTLQETKDDINKINTFSEYTSFFENKSRVFKGYIQLAPYLFIASLVLNFFNFPPAITTSLFFINLGIVGAHLKPLNKVNHHFSSLNQILEKFAILMDLINKNQFSSEKLKYLQGSLKHKNHNASEEIKTLSHYMGQFDQRNGMLAGVILNGIFLWDFKYVFKIEKWLNENKQNLQKWLKVVHEIDALNSLAGYTYNHPEFSYPIPSNSTILQTTNLGHPLIPRGERICNDYDLKESIFTLITGANMSGKSTFLRTVGISIISARCGLPVCAQSMTFKPMKLITNMRTTDSLMKHESYFYAELKRLQYIIEQLEKGQDVFIILDEILKGTNSKDKTFGSMELIKKLLSLNAYGMIATHDLELGILEKENKGKITNLCFEVINKKNELIFDYKLHPGVTQNHNATFLMKQMGIISNK